MELLVVVVILGILVAVALPNYRKSVNRGYRRQAADLLLAIYHGEQAYFYSENTYRCGLTSSSSVTEWREIYVDDPHLGKAGPYPIEFLVYDPGGSCTTAFVAEAKRNGKRMTIDQMRLWCGGSTDPDSCNTWDINDP